LGALRLPTERGPDLGATADGELPGNERPAGHQHALVEDRRLPLHELRRFDPAGVEERDDAVEDLPLHVLLVHLLVELLEVAAVVAPGAAGAGAGSSLSNACSGPKLTGLPVASTAAGSSPLAVNPAGIRVAGCVVSLATPPSSASTTASIAGPHAT
jgi:hypothetical protein